MGAAVVELRFKFSVVVSSVEETLIVELAVAVGIPSVVNCVTGSVEEIISGCFSIVVVGLAVVVVVVVVVVVEVDVDVD